MPDTRPSPGGTVSFEHARFDGGAVEFFKAVFSGGMVSFGGSRFSGGVSFIGSRFSGVTVLEYRRHGGILQRAGLGHHHGEHQLGDRAGRLANSYGEIHRDGFPGNQCDGANHHQTAWWW